MIERLEAMGDSAPRPAIRLVVNEELIEEDVRVLTETGDIDTLEEVLNRRFKNPKEMLEKQRLAMLGWLVKKGLLQVRVGVMRQSGGIVHAKFGIATDHAGDAIVFSGSGNESASGLLANYERLEVSTSWEDPVRLREYRDEFESLWNDSHPDVHTVSLPEALRLKLIKLAPKEPPIIEPSNAAARHKAAMLWRFIVEAPYLENGGPSCDATAMVDLWPHQRRVVEEAAEAWPDGRLLCDEVGMGKTIEAILVLRRLMAGRGVRRALLLLPAGLLKQWQGELREKGGLVFPRLEGVNTLVWPDDQIQKVSGLPEALTQDFLLMSRETARTEGNFPHLLAAESWDLVILDEAHAARRREQVEGEFNRGTLLLDLLRKLQLHKKTRGILLLSATPMQTHPWEPWDLLTILGEGGRWLADFAGVRNYYGIIAELGRGGCDLVDALKAAELIVADPRFPKAPQELNLVKLESTDAIARAIAFAPPTRRSKVAEWLRRSSPLARRMHRNTRSTLRQYHAAGLLSAPPPSRVVNDVVFDFKDEGERHVYDSITQYIERRFQELEAEKPGKGFVMTIYRRRASSSPLALERSLRRRRDGLVRVVEQRAYDTWIPYEENVDNRDLDDLGEVEMGERISAALPTNPKIARAELTDVDHILEDLQSLRGRDSKRDRFFQELRRVTEDGRSVLIFTEYSDTMEYIRENLVTHYGAALGCYSGEGGQIWDGQGWKTVTKDAITQELHAGRLQALVCTDAASEGLNLQAAGAVINYDLPWNPSKVEQRIGRVDRIGQKLIDVRVVNLFLEHSVDERVYKLLRQRCGLFEHFVGAMQPVLARARKMLLGREPESLVALEDSVSDVGADILANENYLESLAETASVSDPPVAREDLELALEALDGSFGPRARLDHKKSRQVVQTGTSRRLEFGSTTQVLERDRKLLPLTALSGDLFALANNLGRPGECLPLVIGTHQQGAFRRSLAYWVGDGQLTQVDSMIDLRVRLESWHGSFPKPAEWLAAEAKARREARRQVEQMANRAAERERLALKRQLEAARLRLKRELGRYLACLDLGTEDLNAVLHQQMTRDIVGAERLKTAWSKLGGYPEWEPELIRELDQFTQSLLEGQRRARLLGKELDAALEDPRWDARLSA